MQNPTITWDRQVHTEIGKTQVDLGKPRPRSASLGRDPTVNHHAPRLDRDWSPLPTHHVEFRDRNPLPTNQTKNLRWGFRVLQNKVPNLEIYGFRESITEGESREEIKKTVSGEQNRGETMLAMEFRESRGVSWEQRSFGRAEEKMKWRERKKSAEMKQRAKKKLK